MKPEQQKPPMQKAPAKKSPPSSLFSRRQVAEDTEREMTGRPQLHGAAMSDDDADDQPSPDAQGGMTPDQPGGDQPGGDPMADENAGPVDPEAAASPEEAEESMRSSPNTPDAHHENMSKHHGSLAKLHQRLKALEGKNGGQSSSPDSTTSSVGNAGDMDFDDGR